MSRLYWSNLPDANRPRDGTSTLCSSLTTEDLPIPEYPDTSTSSKVPVATTQREGFDPAMRLPFRQAAPQISLDTGGELVAFLAGLGEKLHHDCRERSRDA